MASSSLRRCPRAATPSSFRSSAVRLGRTFVYLVFAERSLILSKAKAPQPDHDVHEGVPTGGGAASSAGEARVSRVALGFSGLRKAR